MTMHVIDNMSVEQRDQFADLADKNMDSARLAGEEPNGWLREQFARDVTFAVWKDSRETGGIGVAIVKGKGRYMLVAQGAREHGATVAYIRCTCIEEAEAMCTVYGDGRPMAA